MKEILEIKKGYWRAAGNIFKWTSAGYHVFGVGIEKHWFAQPVINLKIEGELFTLDAEKGKEFVRKYHSFKTIQGRTLAIVSKSLLEKEV